MATYNQVSYGSKGSDVTELQKLLNQNGYTLDTDGIFGSKTQAAVKDYQQKNNLSVDGIVGKNTWGALTKAQTEASTATPEAVDNSFKYDDYAESDIVKQAQAMLEQQMANKPGEYQSTWQDQLNDIINKINNREAFSYDLNGDALYQQYKDQYTTQGKLASMDTMGQAAALTGGYGSSYGQAVGHQAYQGYLQGLNDKVPELYQLALNQYNQQGEEMYNQAALMAQMESQDYGRYRDQVSDYYTELDRLQSQYNTERDYDYGKWADGRDFSYGQFSDDRAYDYQTERDKIADQQWQAQFDEAQRQFNQQYALSASKSSGSSGSSKSSGVAATANAAKAAVAGTGKSSLSLGTGSTKVWGQTEDSGTTTSPTTSNTTDRSQYAFQNYSEAAAELKASGISVGGLLTATEFNRWTNKKLYDNYYDYMEKYVEYKTGSSK